METTGADRLRARFDLPAHEGTSKVMSLAQAVERFVEPCDTVHVAYSDARPNAALLQLARRFAGRPAHLTLVTAGLVNVQHALVALGVVDHVIASFSGENYPAARPNPAFQRALSQGRVSIANWSLWSLTARLVAGALGITHLPVHSLVGSGMAEEHAGVDFAEIDDPFGNGPRVGVVSALRPDVVLLQGVAADRHGNVVMSAPYGESYWGALAARRGVIACVEQIVDTQRVRDGNALVRVPAHTVLAVCEVPFGSHPYGLYNPGFPGVTGYVEDHDFIDDVYRAARDERRFRAWVEEWVLGTRDHDEYLERLGDERRARLSGQAGPDSWRRELPTSLDDGAWNANEMLVIAAARRITERILATRHDAVLAGVGLANLAAWLAVSDLKRRPVDIELMAEIGMFGYDPRPGEPFIFANRNLPTCKVLTDVMGVLGTFVSGPRTHSLGVIGAGQIDEQGNTNSTYTSDGTFLVGSGGANDIASASDEVLLIVTHDPRRLVRTVPYVTCPGRNVGGVVTSGGVFQRSDGRFVLLRYLPTVGDDPRAAVERLRAGCEWEFEVASDLTPEPPPSPDELAVLRSFDPRRLFLRDRQSPPSRTQMAEG